jgi:UDP-N-acetylglucosamine diphosphorylase/glucosamine-1-phosphate N-acetyltransferase
MFSTRERMSLCQESAGGVLLGRDLLKNLHRASTWRWGADSLEDLGEPGDRFLFVNGLLAPDFALFEELLSLAGTGQDFAWHDAERLIAAVVGKEQAVSTSAHWLSWELENAGRGVWADPAGEPEPWRGQELLSGGTTVSLAGVEDHTVTSPGGNPDPGLATRFAKLAMIQDRGPKWIWEIVGCTGEALTGDLKFVKKGRSFYRQPFGIFPHPDLPDPDWSRETTLVELSERAPAGLVDHLIVDSTDKVFCGEGVQLAPGSALDTKEGPIILDRGVQVMPQCFLEGPLYIGPGSLVKPGSRIHGESSFGIVNRVAGEIGESTFGDFTNKQHEGFIGHAVLGSWINLGAMTTCSDLKNNYGQIRVDLGTGPVDSGSRFIGLMMGDHAKTAIGTLFNTGTCVGFASNIFGAGMPPKFVGNFLWGGQVGCPPYALERAQATARVVMQRRGCLFTPGHAELFSVLG